MDDKTVAAILVFAFALWLGSGLLYVVRERHRFGSLRRLIAVLLLWPFVEP